jgi:putative Mg2+ transporter-C (MgtC) family protein
MMQAWIVDIWTTMQQEFSDIPDAVQATRVVIRLLTAVLLGGLLGYERETRGSSAGLRTHMLVALGAALFVAIPQLAGATIEDMSRVIQGVVAGIGFLGAGAIIKLSEDREIKGLTTAASIWLTAAIGVAAGMGSITAAIFSVVLAFVILSVLRRASRKIHCD